MRLARLLTYVDPVVIHRDLEPASLAREVQQLKANYTAMEPDQRRLSDAMSIGAVSGLKLSRQYLDWFSGPAEVVFGNGSRVRPFNAKAGTISNIRDTAAAAYLVAITPRLANVVRPLAKTCSTFIARQCTKDESEFADLRDNLSDLISLFVLDSPATIISLTAAPSVFLGVWASSIVKVASNLPAALVGAVYGAALHRAGSLGDRPTASTPVNFGTRGSRIETTLDFFPIEYVPEELFFLSEDNFGFNVDELAQLAAPGGPGLKNVWTTCPFSEQDINRLKNYNIDLSFDNIPSELLNQNLLLSAWQWQTLLPLFVDVSRALQSGGPENLSKRQNAASALRKLLADVDPISRAEIKIFYQTISRCKVSRMLRELGSDELVAYAIGEQLFRTSATYGFFRANLKQPNCAASNLYKNKPTSLFSTIGDYARQAKYLARIQRNHILEQHPWLQVFAHTPDDFPIASGLPPIDLTVPKLVPPAARQNILNALTQARNRTDGTH